MTGCNRDSVTAPKALEIADDAEQKLWESWNPYVLGQLAQAESNFNPFWPNPDRSTVELLKDGATEQFDAVVIERVFVPPRGHGAPVSRRSFIAWLPNASYGVLAVTETNADQHRAIGNYETENDLLNPRPFLVAPHASEADWWMGQVGKVDIEPHETGRECPFGNGGGDAQADTSGRVTCDVATYTVHLEGELVRRLDLKNTLIPEAMKQRHHILIAPQRVKGIRFTVHCPAKDPPLSWYSSTWYATTCHGPAFIFWRSNSQFSRSLDVDVTQMQRLSKVVPFVFGRTLREGSDKWPSTAPVLRYTVSYPDGTVMERDSTLDFYSVPDDQPWLGQCANGMGYGGRRQCLAEQIGHPKKRSRYGVFVVDVESVARE